MIMKWVMIVFSRLQKSYKADSASNSLIHCLSSLFRLPSHPIMFWNCSSTCVSFTHKRKRGGKGMSCRFSVYKRVSGVSQFLSLVLAAAYFPHPRVQNPLSESALSFLPENKKLPLNLEAGRLVSFEDPFYRVTQRMSRETLITKCYARSFSRFTRNNTNDVWSRRWKSITSL